MTHRTGPVHGLCAQTGVATGGSLGSSICLGKPAVFWGSQSPYMSRRSNSHINLVCFFMRIKRVRVSYCGYGIHILSGSKRYSHTQRIRGLTPDRIVHVIFQRTRLVCEFQRRPQVSLPKWLAQDCVSMLTVNSSSIFKQKKKGGGGNDITLTCFCTFI